MVQISKSTLADLPVLMDLYEQGKRIMRRNGNMHQWTKGYPTEEVVKQDIARGNSYLCLDEDGRPVGTFAFIVGRDPTYARIYDGQWLDDMQPYGTIHRLAGRAWPDGKMPGAWRQPASTGAAPNCPTCGRTPTATTASCNTSSRNTAFATAASSIC